MSCSKENEGNDSRTRLLYSEDCESKKLEFLDRFYRFRNCKTDRNEMVATRTEFKYLIRNYRFEYRKQKTRHLLDLKYKNAKEYLKLLKNSQNVNSSNSLSAQKFKEYFKSISDSSTPHYLADEDILQFNDRFLNSEVQIMFAGFDEQISEQEIVNAIKKLHSGKSGGPDRLLNEFFIHEVSILSKSLSKLFNVILDSGHFPFRWPDGHIVPIHKKRSVNEVENYGSPGGTFKTFNMITLYCNIITYYIKI